MTLLDLLLILTLFGFIWFGIWFGAIHMLGGLIGTVLGAYTAGQFTLPITLWLANSFGLGSLWIKLAVFILLFVITNRIVGFIFYLIDRIFKFVSVIPFLKTINRLAGAVFGLLEGMLVIGLTLYFASHLQLPLLFQMAIASSSVAAKLIGFAEILVPLLPDIIRQAKSYIPGINLPIPN
ncbi:MAG: CvpA family protein [Patescibacteria group bacterium]